VLGPLRRARSWTGRCVLVWRGCESLALLRKRRLCGVDGRARVCARGGGGGERWGVLQAPQQQRAPGPDAPLRHRPGAACAPPWHVRVAAAAALTRALRRLVLVTRTPPFLVTRKVTRMPHAAAAAAVSCAAVRSETARPWSLSIRVGSIPRSETA
jgi:hypothetical protein